MRTADITRSTKETSISLSINLDGTGMPHIETGIGFFDHMLALFSSHSLIDLTVKAKGDIEVDGHHTVEDVGIALGQAVSVAIRDKTGIRRYGFFTLPMDEVLASAAVDFSGRPFLAFNAEFKRPKIGEFDVELVHEFWQAFSNSAACNLHLNVHYGENGHHISEALFKAAARSIRAAVELDPRQKGIPSSKGTL